MSYFLADALGGALSDPTKLLAVLLKLGEGIPLVGAVVHMVAGLTKAF